MSKVIFGPLPLASVGHGSSEENLPYTVHTILAGYMVLWEDQYAAANLYVGKCDVDVCIECICAMREQTVIIYSKRQFCVHFETLRRKFC